MLGGAIKKDPTTADPIVVRHTEEWVCDSAGKLPSVLKDRWNNTVTPKATDGHPIRIINLGGGYAVNGTTVTTNPSEATGVRTQIVYDATTAANNEIAGKKILFKNPKMLGSSATQPSRPGDHLRVFWEEVLDGTDDPETAVEVTISPDTFPGTYRIIGDTFMRSEKTGKDEPFQFIINKAKVQSNVTITLEAEGDPSTFEMTLNVLRSTNEDGANEMMKLVRYSVGSGSGTAAGDDHGSVEGST